MKQLQRFKIGRGYRYAAERMVYHLKQLSNGIAFVSPTLFVAIYEGGRDYYWFSKIDVGSRPKTMSAIMNRRKRKRRKREEEKVIDDRTDVKQKRGD